MDMPKDGRYLVDITSSPNGKVTLCLFMNIYTNAPVYGGALTEVPTPYGRLVDADELMDIIKQHDYPLADAINSRNNGMFTIGIQEAVDLAPTVIEAEEG